MSHLLFLVTVGRSERNMQRRENRGSGGNSCLQIRGGKGVGREGVDTWESISTAFMRKLSTQAIQTGSPRATWCLGSSSAILLARVAAKAAHSGRALSSSDPRACSHHKQPGHNSVLNLVACQ